MSEQLKQELEADTDRLEAETVADSETIGEQEEKPTEGKLEAQEDDESKEEDTVPMGKASLVDIVSGIPAPTRVKRKVRQIQRQTELAINSKFQSVQSICFSYLYKNRNIVLRYWLKQYQMQRFHQC